MLQRSDTIGAVDYDALISEGLTTPFEGWDFGALAGRLPVGEEALPWRYADLAREHLAAAGSLLDLGTGGGELLTSLGPLPARTAATEGHPPNVPVARRRLAPLGVMVADVSKGEPDTLPYPDASFDLVLSRHESYEPEEVRRVLVPGGVFLTQQVGGRDLAEVNAALGAGPHTYREWCLAAAEAELSGSGFEITRRGEAAVPGTIDDVGALVLFLRITPWHVPDFDVVRYDDRLRALHARLRQGRPLRVHSHRFMLTARTPAA
ncbi:SAM-dependent methyltransferase [Actinoalloteichus hoggarensis]|uniref:Methyltransferase domain protein n=1 Tax=Actinoalloteichus hoggarensis TaxID=1470176 RepID=A0A221VZ36_9PSEU|nr:class I SAM-dependent methyltransferase [Actinoalloteichus hoggarensis]ASO18797.1 Methyltransferase domain protein [Actinoalloteichus hoggarensis]MBB5920030.1 SAM-dependent methyltransferase [Actinoalloteichus hoggarensis]